MNKWIKRKLCIGVAIAMTITSIAGCNSAKSGKNSVDSAAQKTETSSEKSDDSKKAEAPQIDGPVSYTHLVIEKLKDQGIRDKFKVMVGGSPISKKFADDIGAEGYLSLIHI